MVCSVGSLSPGRVARRWLTWIAMAALMIVFAALSTGIAAAQATPRLEIFGGYSYLRFDSKTIGFTNNSNLNGFNGSIAYDFTRGFSVVVDASGNYGSGISFYNFLIGPQVTRRRERNTLFGRFLIGKARDDVNSLGGKTSIGRTIGFGGGYDYEYSPRVTIRVVQVDYLNTHTYNQTQNNVRVSAGFVLHWGKH